MAKRRRTEPALEGQAPPVCWKPIRMAPASMRAESNSGPEYSPPRL